MNYSYPRHYFAPGYFFFYHTPPSNSEDAPEVDAGKAPRCGMLGHAGAVDNILAEHSMRIGVPALQVDTPRMVLLILLLGPRAN